MSLVAHKTEPPDAYSTRGEIERGLFTLDPGVRAPKCNPFATCARARVDCSFSRSPAHFVRVVKIAVSVIRKSRRTGRRRLRYSASARREGGGSIGCASRAGVSERNG